MLNELVKVVKVLPFLQISIYVNRIVKMMLLQSIFMLIGE